ncbi:hypothetical protein HS961_20880 [Comamonas piscis]|uniref:Uncharacterized protein n=1 Tax=Comamonas piscis TaxID=1562974 RepID=A0A7G5EM76_9BURK|nr:hypothetical protein [Comamonas piscis]QMV75101.1 hypothetical protein HS961_20880 [Comamonas piscis]WSO33585.1 hypothetical protein VUJ63_20945 [Comamonas piscis]
MLTVERLALQRILPKTKGQSLFGGSQQRSSGWGFHRFGPGHSYTKEQYSFAALVVTLATFNEE